MSDASDPPRKHYQLKPREFDVVNEQLKAPSVPAAETPPAAFDSGVAAASGTFDVRELARLGAQTGSLLSGNAPANRENDVHAMLRDNLAKANAAGLNDLAPLPRRRSRRRRDYIALLIAGNLFIAGAYTAEMFLGFQVQCIVAHMPNEFMNLVRFALANPATYILAPVGMLFYSGCLTWLMFGIMQNY